MLQAKIPYFCHEEGPSSRIRPRRPFLGHALTYRRWCRRSRRPWQFTNLKHSTLLKEIGLNLRYWPAVQQIWSTSYLTGSGGVVDLTEIKEQEAEGEEASKRRKLGIPELDPEALPSASCNKYLCLCSAENAKRLSAAIRANDDWQFHASTFDWSWGPTVLRSCLAKRITKLAAMAQKFNEAESLTDIQRRPLYCFRE